MDVAPRLSRPLRAVWALAALALLAYTAHVAFGFGGAGLDAFFQDLLYPGLTLVAAGACLARAIAVPQDRIAWLLMAAGLGASAAGDLYWGLAVADDPDPRYPSVADALYLVMYPASYVTVVLLVRSRMSHFRASQWLDGAIGALAVGAVAAAVAFQPIVDATSGSGATVATNLSYPVGDVALLTLVVAVFGISGWRPGRAWILLGGGLFLSAAADGLFLVETALGTYQAGTLLDVLWPASALLVGLAAWQPTRLGVTPRIQGARIAAVPFVSALAAIGLLVYDHFERINAAALLLTTGTLLLAVVRTALVLMENQRMLASSRAEARTDPLTGLRNRRSLMVDLDRELGTGGPRSRRALLLFDLDGFKEYNDVFGHPAGDGLLARLGGRLADAVREHGRAYRLGGDEFCALVTVGAEGAEPLVAACIDALTDRGEGFDVTTSNGAVLLPEEAQTPTQALQLADRRMYAHKGDRRMSARRQSRDVLLSTLSERRPELRARLRDVAEMALVVGRELAMSPEALDEVARAAELHDLGKVAIPDAILDKAGPLDDAERSFMRRHTIIGERILLAAPALRPVARLVRSSHERWDGGGYPDGLVGEEIPLGARVVAVCDAFDAMTTDRPHRARMDAGAALAELRACAGTQFDPAVVDAFCSVLTREAAA
jgi:two-component system cell cycle response regulator